MSSENIEKPTVEEGVDENVVVVEEQQQQQQEEQQEEQEVSNSFQVFIKTPVEIGTIKIQVQPTDTLMDIQTFLYETSETCLYSSYEFHLDGVALPEYSELSSIEGLVEGSTLVMVPIDYNERSAKLHVKRLRDIMNTGLTEFTNMSSPSLFSSFSFPEKSNFLTEEQIQQQQQEFEEQQQKLANGESIEPPTTTTTTTTPTEDKSSTEKPSKKNGFKKSSKKDTNKTTDKKDDEKDENGLTPQQRERKIKLTEMKGIERPQLSNYYPESVSPVIQCVKSMIYSGWSPVPGYRKLFGDLFYLDITLLEGTTVCVTASTSGFFINQSTNTTFNPAISPKATINHSLHQLLTQVSRLFRRGLNQILVNISRNHPFDMLPGIIPVHNWVASNKLNRFDISKGTDTFISVQDVELRGNPRDWNEEIQAPKELPKNTVQERIVRDRAISKVNSEFVECAIRGAQVIVDKAILPINPTDPERGHMFLYNNIFFSYALDTRNTYSDCGGDQAARTSANNDLKGIRLYNLADIDGLYTLGTAIVDYKGQRVVAQSLIPGILTTEKTSKIFYGSMDSTPTEEQLLKAAEEGVAPEDIPVTKSIKADPEFHERLLKAASLLHLSESTVISEEENQSVKVCTSYESKGIVGIDGRRYILDLIKATPRDPNYLETKDQLAILRPEAIATYTEYYKITWLNQIKQQRLKEKIEKEKAEGKEPTAKITDADLQLSEEDIQNAPSVLFNPNLFSKVKLGGTEEEQSKDEAELKSVGVFLKNVIIPRLIEDLMLFSINPVDGQTLTSNMHARGINMRYLGFIAKNESAATVPFIQDLLFNEMVSRAAKHSFNKLLRSTGSSDLAHSIAHFLNCFLGTETGSVTQEEKKQRAKQVKSTAVNELTQAKLWKDIAEQVVAKFDFEIPTHSVPMESRLIVLRSICLKMGIQILAKDYNFTTDYPFSPEDIVDLHPIVKHINPRSTDGLDLLEAGKNFFNKKKFDIANEFLNEALAIYHQVHGPIHPDASNCFTHLAMLAFHREQFDLAIEYQKNALVINEKTMGLDHHETLSCYSTLGVFCQRAGRYNEAMGYLKRALYLTDLLGGEYNSERSSIYTTIAGLLEETEKFDLALEFLKQTLRHQEFLFGKNHLMCSTTYHKMSIISARKGDFEQSIDYQKQSLAILEKDLGADHPRTKESADFCNGLVQTANHIKLFQHHQALKAEQEEQAKLQKEKADQLKKSQPKGLSNPPKINTDNFDELLNYINGKSRSNKKSSSASNKKPSTTTTTTTTATPIGKSNIKLTATTTTATSSKSSSTATATNTTKSSSPSSASSATSSKSTKKSTK